MGLSKYNLLKNALDSVSEYDLYLLQSTEFVEIITISE